MIVFMFYKLPYLYTYMHISALVYFGGRERIRAVITEKFSHVLFYTLNYLQYLNFIERQDGNAHTKNADIMIN